MAIEAGAVESRIGADISGLKSGIAQAAAALRGFEQTAQRSLERALDASGVAPSVRKGVEGAVGEIRKALARDLANARDSLANGIIDPAAFAERCRKAGDDAAKELRKQFDTLTKNGILPPEVGKRLADDLTAAARKAGAEAGRDLKSGIEQAMEPLKSGFASLAKQIVLPVAGLFAVNQIRAFGAESVRAFAAAEESLGRLNAMVAANANAVGRSGAQLVGFSKTLQKETLFQAGEIERAMAQLLTYHSITGATFERTIRIATDLSSVFGGLSQSTEAIARALDDPILGLAMLAKQGFRFEDSVKAQIKALVEQNRLFEAQDIILRDLESQVGGVATGMKTGVVGAINDVGKGWLALREAIGRTIVTMGHGEAGARGLAGTLQKFSLHTDDAAAAVVAFGKATAVVAGAAGLVKLATALNGVTLSVGALSGALTTGLAALNPITLVAGAAAIAIGALAVDFYKSGESARAAAKAVDEYRQSLSDLAQMGVVDAIATRRRLEADLAMRKEYDRQIKELEDKKERNSKISGGEMGLSRADQSKLDYLKQLRDAIPPAQELVKQIEAANAQVEKIRNRPVDVAAMTSANADALTQEIAQLKQLKTLRELNTDEAKRLTAAEAQLRAVLARGGLSREQEIKALQALQATKAEVKELTAALHSLEGGAAVARLLGDGFATADPQLRAAAESAAKIGAELKDAEAAMKALGSQAPAGAAAHVDDLRARYAAATAELQKLAAEWQAVWAKVANPPAPKLAGGVITTKAFVGPTVEQIEAEFAAKMGILNEQFARGLIDPKALERGGKEAARQFNEALLRYLQGQKLEPKIRAEIQAKLKLDLGDNAAAWKEVSGAAGTAAMGLVNVGDALGKMGDGARRALTGVSALAQSMGSLKSGPLMQLGNVPGIVGMIGAAVQIGAAMFAKDPAEAARQKELVDALNSLAASLGGFRATANAIQKTAVVAQGVRSTKGPISSAEYFFAMLDKQGITLQEIIAVAKEFGVALVNDKGQLDITKLASAEFGKILEQASKTLVGFRNTLDDQKRRQSLSADLFNLPTDAASGLAQQMEMLSKFMPELAKGLGDIDTATAEGRARLEAEIQRMFSAFEAGSLDLEDLTRDEFLSLIEGFAGAFDKFREATEKASGALLNVPPIFDLALRRRQAALAGAGPIMIPPPPSAPTPYTPGAGSTSGGGRVRPQPKLEVNIHNPPAGMDVPRTATMLKNALKYDPEVRMLIQRVGAN